MGADNLRSLRLGVPYDIQLLPTKMMRQHGVKDGDHPARDCNIRDQVILVPGDELLASLPNDGMHTIRPGEEDQGALDVCASTPDKTMP